MITTLQSTNRSTCFIILRNSNSKFSEVTRLSRPWTIRDRDRVISSEFDKRSSSFSRYIVLFAIYTEKKESDLSNGDASDHCSS